MLGHVCYAAQRGQLGKISACVLWCRPEGAVVEILPCTYELLGNWVQSKQQWKSVKLSLYLYVLPLFIKNSHFIYICFTTFIVYHHYYFNLLDHSDVGILVLFGTLAGLLRSYYYKSRLGRRISITQLHEASYL